MSKRNYEEYEEEREAMIGLLKSLEASNKAYKGMWEYLEKVSKSGELTEVMNNIKNQFLSQQEESQK
jgi:hypothetical protein